jgi:hypothetical protein
MSGALLMAATILSSSAAPSGSVSITNQNYSRTGNSTTTVSEKYKLVNDGTVQKVGATLETWLVSGTVADFEAMVTVQSGALASGTTGSWLALSSTRTWTVSASPGNTSTCTFLVQIRDAATQTVLDSATITISVTNNYSAPSVSLSDRTVFKSGSGGATATYKINADGTVTDQDNTFLENWLFSGSASDYQVRATLASGTSPGGSAVGSWLACSTNRSWSEGVSAGGGSVTCTLTIEIRDVATNTVRTSASIIINAFSA